MAVIEQELTEESAEERSVRDELRAWLRENLPDGWMDAVERGDRDTVRRLRDTLKYAEWCKTLAYAGWATPTYPPEYNGKGYGMKLARVVNEELSRAGVPRSYNVIGIGMGAPTIL